MQTNKYRLGAVEPNSGAAADLWYRSAVPRATMKQLMQRSDVKAVRDTLLWYALILGSGVLAYLSVGTLWALPAFFLYGTLYAGPADSRWHEAGHGTAFRSRWMNALLYQTASFQVMRRPAVWRWSHTRHHTHTLVTGRDPEIQIQLPLRVLGILGDFIGLKLAPLEFLKAFANAAGYMFEEEKTFIPESEYRRVRTEAQAWVLVFAGVAAAAVYSQSWLPPLFIGLPSVYGGWLYNFFGVTQHAALPENVRDHRLNARTVLMNPVFRFLYWNMNYHVEHHMFPMVPYHALAELHAVIRKDCPPPYASTWQAYREIIPALLRQWRDPEFHIVRPLPNRGIEMAETWIDACAADAVEPEDVIRFDHAGRTYAIYRSPEDAYYATDGLCTHEQVHLADGLVMDDIIECPMHNGRFNYKTGAAKGAPACINLKTYPAKVESGRVLIRLE